MSNESDDGLLELADVLARLGSEMKRAAEVEDPTIQWFGAEVELESVVERTADGSVRFISDTIDCGNQATPAQPTWPTVTRRASPYGVWGALGTKAGGESTQLPE